MKDNLTATDAKEIEREVTDSIRNDIKAGLVDMTVTAAFSVEGDEEEEEDTELWSDKASVDLPKVPVWYRNAVMGNLWEEASPSQWDTVEQHKKKEEDREKTDDDSDDEMEDDQHMVKRLQIVMKFVTSRIW
jgi:hypothetical protein